MTTPFTAPKGTYDLLPPASEEFLAVVNALSRPAELAGYQYVQTPMFEDTALFTRSVGESTDVVSKEMYTFEDKGGRSLTLRPEGTAGVIRAVVEHNLLAGQLPVKLWYTGPNFRYEAPQSGRYRQHVQVGIEAIGVDDPALDAEVIATAAEGFRALGLTQARLLLNSLGDATCRPAYRERLQEFLGGLDLDADTRRRAEINPLRVLDDKRPEVRAQLAGAPLLADNLCEACREHYDEVRGYLKELGVQWEEAPRLVRGLDYYTKTTFEFQHDGLGSQSAVGGGGRYDGLVESVGGPALSGIGFGLGVDRTMLALRAEGIAVADPARCQVFIVPLGAAKARAVTLAGELRRAGVSTDLAYGGRGLKGAMKAADRSGARYAVVIGERDLEGGTAQLKDLASGDQVAVPLTDAVSTIQEKRS
ncbi:MAG: histidyl-tRNA synthetase [Cryptosporangiaceae bacterium]|nr:histidyl-tRNA synthetase [Cryptosporangiaceae bacterium]